MLPVKAGTKKLSDESKGKLDLFHKRFCEGDNRALYGLQHIVYACHASFPLILSPELANLIWLNFNAYTSGDVLQKIEEVVVSDFLLSPLVRPVANRQYEVIPELRTYFLYLLKDSRWFNLFGIESFGDKRLSELAEFLKQYLQDPKAKRENNASGFRELNQWAADAWLDPDRLAIQMANSLKELLPADNSTRENEWGQLRLNIMAERLGRQIDLNIHSKEADGVRLFVNFQKYSRANAARLVDRSRPDLYSFYDEVDTDFIEKNVTDKRAVRLPIQPGIGQRLFRKKNNVQRILPLVIRLDELGNFSSGLQGHEGFDIILNYLRSNPAFEISDPVLQLSGQKKTRVEMTEAINTVFQHANDEDIVLVYSTDSGKKRSPYAKTSSLKEPGTFVNHSVIHARLKEGKGNKLCQTVLILDTQTTENDIWVNAGDVQITLRQSQQSTFHLLTTILQLSEYKITYRDLQNCLRENAATDNGVSFIMAPGDQWNNHFLTKNRKQRSDAVYPVIFNGQEEAWQAIDEDFNPIPLNLNTHAFTYEGVPVEDVYGEVFTGYGDLRFGGITSGLHRDRLYMVKPNKDWLSVQLTGAALFNNPHEFAGSLSELFQKIPAGVYTKWGGFNLDEQFNENASAKMMEQKRENTLGIHPFRTVDNGDVFYGVFFNDVRKQGNTQFSWQVEGITELGESLQKFNRYQYVMELERPSAASGYLDYVAFSVTYLCQWVNKDGSPSGEAYHSELPVNELAVVVENGQVAIKPLELQIESMEDVELFYSVYLLATDMSITRLTKETVNKINPHELIRQSFQLDPALLELFSLGGSAHLKVLFSLAPVIVDLSQTGIK